MLRVLIDDALDQINDLIVAIQKYSTHERTDKVAIEIEYRMSGF